LRYSFPLGYRTLYYYYYFLGHFMFCSPSFFGYAVSFAGSSSSS